MRAAQCQQIQNSFVIIQIKNKFKLSSNYPVCCLYRWNVLAPQRETAGHRKIFGQQLALEIAQLHPPLLKGQSQTSLSCWRDFMGGELQSQTSGNLLYQGLVSHSHNLFGHLEQIKFTQKLLKGFETEYSKEDRHLTNRLVITHLHKRRGSKGISKLLFAFPCTWINPFSIAWREKKEEKKTQLKIPKQPRIPVCPR